MHGRSQDFFRGTHTHQIFTNFQLGCILFFIFTYFFDFFRYARAYVRTGSYAPGVIYQKRGRVFHQDIETPRSGLKNKGGSNI